ncbi:MarR family transcriptional regulator [Pontibacter qinzhouensis]|uniref:MarR family transcriptional regulator n=1 Tax=Pontibacter qinzhouensis TaxID=2603253 RepID=A0A5C8K852_9BACT|nr:MarR family transcriptional regulator [Pontibacter qinzhouensis]TXK45340.1 MarR family transcriptional regulator [Pontibacter qinzhouensis]
MDTAENYEQLKLENQICFPLYAASRLVTRLYQPLLDALNLTYPQYLVLLVLWEHDGLSVNQIGEKLHLHSNTLTPLLKRLEQQGLLQRRRSTSDERQVQLFLTPQGTSLKAKAAAIPAQLAATAALPLDKALALKAMLDELLKQHQPT